ncbi:class I tRNA ligase family protein [Candidatus Wolfebacteria bacterium]|nr:class I tRNA ligase family protein [Candidatus Wolfebacteria bacterium]
MFGDLKNLKPFELEEKILKYWQEHRIFEKSFKSRTTRTGRGLTRKDYVFYDGPPFATGLPHYGHILASVIKDVIPRYQTMKGYRVERKWGWDCHGLPIENIIEQNLSLETKKDIEKFGVGKFNEAARNEVLRYVSDWKKIIPRIGRWVDMENDYRTMDSEYTESVWWVFKTLYDKKLIYEGYKSMHICPRCETTLSNFEVAQGYKDIEDSSVIVEFELEETKNQKPKTKNYLLAWTTTPWTLPGNAALAVNPKVKYVKVEGQIPGNAYILAESRVESVFGKEYKIVRSVDARDLIGKKYKPLFDYYAKPQNDAEINAEQRRNGWRIYPADFVKTDEGTGIVHIAPAFGADDMALGQKYDLPFIQHVGMDGRFKPEVKDFSGLPVKPKGEHESTDNKIIELLEKKDKLFKSERITHSYPHCWRCETPLLNYAASSWFVKVTAIKNDLLSNNQKINWVPKHLKDGRFGRGLEDAPDWAISRSRYWGAPIPVWRCQAGKSEILNPKSCNGIKIIGSLQELKDALPKSDNQYFLMRHGEARHNVLNVLSSDVKKSTKYPLTPRGREEVRETAKKLRKEKIDLIFSSDFFRSKETTFILKEALNLPREKIIFDKRLREVNTGAFDGESIRNYRAYAPLLERFVKNPPQGENLTELKNRVTEFLYEINSRYKNKKILIVSHEYPIWLMAAGAIGADDKKSVVIKKAQEDDFIKTGAMMRLDFSPLPHNDNFELDLHRPYIDEFEINCSCGSKMKRVEYVFDCWFESGAMPYGQSHYPFENKAKFEKNFPAKFIAEGVDMTRGWFYTLHVLGTSLFGKPAFKNVIVNGIVLAEDGQKMSKRLKNYPDPMDIVAKYGVDTLRFYLLSSPAVRAEDLNFSEKGVDEIYKKVILRLLNVFSFYEIYAGRKILTTNDKRQTTKNLLDLWILGRLKELVGSVSKAMDGYELDQAVRPIADFIDDLSTWYIRRSRERFKSDNGSRGAKNKKEAIATTQFILSELSKVTAPFVPFLADLLHLKLNKDSEGAHHESVHLAGWPKVEKLSPSEKKLIYQMKEIRRLASLALEARAQARVKIRQPLQKLEIKNEKLEIRKNQELLKILADEINVKKIIFDAKIKNEVELDTKITPALREEGILRDFVRIVQDLRQKAGYLPKDKIYLWLEAPPWVREALGKQVNQFKLKIGAKNVEFRKSEKFDAELETQFENQPIWMGLKKIS